MREGAGNCGPCHAQGRDGPRGWPAGGPRFAPGNMGAGPLGLTAVGGHGPIVAPPVAAGGNVPAAPKVEDPVGDGAETESDTSRMSISPGPVRVGDTWASGHGPNGGGERDPAVRASQGPSAASNGKPLEANEGGPAQAAPPQGSLSASQGQAGTAESGADAERRYAQQEAELMEGLEEMHAVSHLTFDCHSPQG